MTLETTPYLDYEKNLPQSGNHILAQERNGNLIVYQAFQPAIAKYALEHQRFGGSDYSFSRMSWIKPNFLWMMYRAGWASKPGQEHILAIEISKVNFLEILENAVHATYSEAVYGTREAWKNSLETAPVRLQWDPDHNPYGEKLQRRAIQLGLKDEILNTFANEWIVSIEDISDFVKEQAKHIAAKELDNLMVMKESVLDINDLSLKKQLAIA